MNLVYYKEANGNFGDDLNEWIWDYLIPGWRKWDKNTTLLGIGTLINRRRLEALCQKKVLILGSGTGYGKIPDLPLPKTWDVRSVRGPRTAAQLNLTNDKAIIDPAVMVSDIAEFQSVQKTDTPIFIPHHFSIDRYNFISNCWQHACSRAGLKYISPRDNAKIVIKSIAAAPLVIAESMHAAIIADSFRVPWIPVQIYHGFNLFKWTDWAASLKMDLDIPMLFPILGNANKAPVIPRVERYQRYLIRILEAPRVSRQLKKVSEMRQQLSDTLVLEERKRQYRVVLDQVIVDYG